MLIVVNNNGGQIFSLLPTPEEDRQRFYMPQNVEFSHAAAMFQLGYARPENWSQLQQAVEQGWRRGGATLIELQVTPSAGPKACNTWCNRWRCNDAGDANFATGRSGPPVAGVAAWPACNNNEWRVIAARCPEWPSLAIDLPATAIPWR